MCVSVRCVAVGGCEHVRVVGSVRVYVCARACACVWGSGLAGWTRGPREGVRPEERLGGFSPPAPPGPRVDPLRSTIEWRRETTRVAGLTSRPGGRGPPGSGSGLWRRSGGATGTRRGPGRGRASREWSARRSGARGVRREARGRVAAAEDRGSERGAASAGAAPRRRRPRLPGGQAGGSEGAGERRRRRRRRVGRAVGARGVWARPSVRECRRASAPVEPRPAEVRASKWVATVSRRRPRSDTRTALVSV